MVQAQRRAGENARGDPLGRDNPHRRARGAVGQGKSGYGNNGPDYLSAARRGAQFTLLTPAN
jgi:hypothetical protein